MAESDSRRALVLLTLGAGVGLALAAFGLLGADRRAGATLSADAVARVNGTLIREVDYLRVLAGVERDTRGAVDRERRQHVLDRMIEEELLVQRALELGLARVDRRVRADLVSAVIASVSAEAESREPTDAEVREFYAAERGFFAHPGRLRVRQVFFRVPDASAEAAAGERAAAAHARLTAGGSLEEVRAELGDPELSPLPDAPLPPAKLLEYLGPTALRAVSELEVGEVSEPVRSGTGFHVLWLLEREPARTPALEEIEPQVRGQWRRRVGDRALRTYLDDLRARADIATRDALP